ATVLGTASRRCVGGDRVGFAFTFNVDTVGVYAFTDQVVFNGVSATLGKTQVVLLGTDRVGVAGSDKGFEIDRRGLCSNLIKHQTAFGLQGGLVEVEER